MSNAKSETKAKSAKKATKRARKTARKSEPEIATSDTSAAVEPTNDNSPSAEKPVASATGPTIGEPQGEASTGNRPKRRRGKKGKGNNDNQESPTATNEGVSSAEDESGASEPSPTPSPIPQPSHSPQQHPPRNPQSHNRPPRYNPEELAHKAWKIYLAEVSEEGIALINDNDARDIARRCFRLAGIFLDEQSRQR